jgi:glycosyltransferase involved in cell wall biosynthesis
MPQIKRATLFSRDERTFEFFRRGWLIALNNSDFQAKVFNRGFGSFRLLKAIVTFIVSRKSLRLIFGTSEICLYYFFSSRQDVLIFTGLGRLLQKKGLRKNFICSYLRVFYKNQKIVALNSDDASFLGSIFAGKIVLIDGEGFNFNGSQVTRDLGNPIVIAFIGRMLKSKGVDKLIEEFLLIEGNDCELHLYGDFDFSNSDSINSAWLSSKISASKGKICYHGFVKNVRDILGGVDIFVSLSEREGLPFSVLEALDAGCFILLSAVPGHFPFASFAGVNLINQNDVLGALNSLIDNPQKIIQFNQKQRIMDCDRRFGMDAIVNQIRLKIL